MADVLTYVVLATLIVVAALGFMYATSGTGRRKPQSIVKRDWVPTGRIDFTAPVNPKDTEQPTEFRLLIEEHRIVESIVGNENLEIQWRLAALTEAKTVVTQYHKYLSQHSLIKSVLETSPSLVPAMATQDQPSESLQGTGQPIH